MKTIGAGDFSPRPAHSPRVNLTLPPAIKPPRLDALDLLRGLVMVLMALDHVRLYFTNVRFDPLDLEQTWPAMFMTRWITHFCAPVFVFLAGTGAFLAGTRGKSTRELAWFLLTRGTWLVILEHTVVRFGWLFNLDYSLMISQVIWAIGWSMIVLSGLVFLRMSWITLFGVGMIVLHNAFDRISGADLRNLEWLWLILHDGGWLQINDHIGMLVAYPLVPWIGVMAAGYGFGALLQRDPARRNRALLQLGFGMVLLFIVLRAADIYGDPGRWNAQSSFLTTVFDFIHVEKYPPSLLFLLMTLGPAIASLVLLQKLKGGVASFFIVFGRVSLFFYVLHIPLIHGLAMLAAAATGHGVGFLVSNVEPTEWPSGYGFDVWVLYLVWLVVVAALYPLSRRFAEIKRKSSNPLLGYL